MGSSPLITVCMKTIITVIFFRLFRFGQKWRKGKNWNIHNIAGFWLKHNDQSLKKDFRLTYLTLVKNSPFIQHLIELILSSIHFHLLKKKSYTASSASFFLLHNWRKNQFIKYFMMKTFIKTYRISFDWFYFPISRLSGLRILITVGRCWRRFKPHLEINGYPEYNKNSCKTTGVDCVIRRRRRPSWISPITQLFKQNIGSKFTSHIIWIIH